MRPTKKPSNWKAVIEIFVDFAKNKYPEYQIMSPLLLYKEVS